MSSCSSYLETTYSQDVRIEKDLYASKEQEKKDEQEIDSCRRASFESCRKKAGSLFNLKGLHFVEFSHLKVKFIFKPFEVGKFFEEDFEFSGTFIFRSQYWAVKYDTFPVKLKPIIYHYFYGKPEGVIDKNIIKVLKDIYYNLVKWTEKYCDLKVYAYQRFLNGEDVYVNDADHALYAKYFS